MTEQTESEIDIQSRIRIALSRFGCVCRMNTGTFYQGTLSHHPITHQPILTNIRVVKVGLDGLPDLMLIGNGGTVSFIEVKSATGHCRADQKQFLKFLADRGYKAGVARSVEDALEIIKAVPNIVDAIERITT